MNAGILQYTLGLSTAGFLGPLSGATGGLLRFAGIATSLGGVVAGVFSQIARGADLNDLSKRTGESVGNLFQLQKGFQAAGLSMDSVAPALFQMQKAIGGFNEMGEPTKNIFSALGLSVERLKGMDAPGQFTTISEALAGLNREEAALAASKIFGRGAAGDMLQLARSSNEFANGMAKSAETAALFGRNAEAFERVERTMEQLKNKGSSLFAGIAEGAAPGIQRFLDTLNQIDLSGLGQRIGSVLGSFTRAAEVGKLGELFQLTLESAFGHSANFLGQQMQRIAAAFPAMLAAGMSASKSIGDYLVANTDAWMARAANAQAEKYQKQGQWGLANMELVNAQNFLAHGRELQTRAGQEIQKSIAAAAQAASDASNAKVVDLVNTKPTDARLNELVKSLQLPGEAARQLAGGGSAGLLSTITAAGAAGRPSVNALERIGLITGMGSGLDHSGQTARNTERLVQIAHKQTQLLDAISKQTPDWKMFHNF